MYHMGSDPQQREGALSKVVTSGFSRAPPSTIFTCPDIEISPHADDRHSDRPSQRQSSVTLNFPNEKSPCYASSCEIL